MREFTVNRGRRRAAARRMALGLVLGGSVLGGCSFSTAGLLPTTGLLPGAGGRSRVADPAACRAWRYTAVGAGVGTVGLAGGSAGGFQADHATGLVLGSASLVALGVSGVALFYSSRACRPR